MAENGEWQWFYIETTQKNSRVSDADIDGFLQAAQCAIFIWNRAIV